MTTTPCPICEADADVLPIPDFDSEAFHLIGFRRLSSITRGPCRKVIAATAH